MSFAWPPALGALLLVPVLVAAYLRLAQRRARRAEELARQGFVPSAAALRRQRRRHVPFVCFLAALTVLLIGVARPQASVSVPRREGTVILAFDVSNSMRADDMEPTRMDAAKAAATEFVKRQPGSVRLGVVAFSDGALVTQQPTDDHRAVLAAINRLNPVGATSLGQGLFTAVNAIAGGTLPTDLDLEALADPEQPVELGYYGSAAVVLLSDGENTNEPDPRAMARLASVAGVKVYPIGLGRPEGTVVEIEGFNVSTALDEETLTDIARVTDGTYHRAADAAALTDVYRSIDLEWKRVPERTELTSVAAATGLVLLLVGAGLSLAWFGRPV